MADRVLDHLWTYPDADQMRTAPLDVSQRGIANNLGVSRTQASRILRNLEEDGLVYTSLRRIRGLSRRQKAYHLTREGQRAYRTRIGRHLRVPSPSALSPPPEPFVGRRSAEKRFRKWWEVEDGVLFLIGPAGIGKTAFLRTVLPDLEGVQVRYRTLSPRDDRAGILEYIAKRLVPNDPMVARRAVQAPNPDRTWAALENPLREAGGLWVFDHLDQASQGVCELVLDLAARSPGVGLRMVLVHREPETAWLTDISARSIKLGPLADRAARRLLGKEVADPAAIISKLGGHPGLLRWASEVGPGISGTTELLEAVLVDLSADRRWVLDLMAVHRLPVYRRAIPIRFQGQDALGALVARELVEVRHQDGLETYLVPETLREAARHHMDERRMLAAHRLAAEYYAMLPGADAKAERILHLLEAGEVPEALAVATADLEALTGPLVARILELTEALQPRAGWAPGPAGLLTYLRAAVRENEGALPKAGVEYTRALAGDLPRALRIRSRERLGTILRLGGHHSDARETLEIGLASDDLRARERGRLLDVLGLVHLDERDIAGAELTLHRALAAARTARDRDLEARILLNLALTAVRANDRDAADDHLASALRLLGEAGAAGLRMSGYRLLGHLRTVQGRIHEALEAFERSRVAGERAGDVRVVYTQAALAHHLSLVGDLDRAREVAERALPMVQDSGAVAQVAYVLRILGTVAWMRGDLEEAFSHYLEALAILEEVDRDPDRAWILLFLGRAYLDAGDPLGAKGAFERAAELLPDDREFYTIPGRVDVALIDGDLETADRLWSGLHEDPSDIDHLVWVWSRLRTEAALARHHGEVDRARTILTGAAEDCPFGYDRALLCLELAELEEEAGERAMAKRALHRTLKELRYLGNERLAAGVQSRLLG